MTKQAMVEQRLREDTEFYARSLLRIVNESSASVPFTFRPAQRKVDQALESQRLAGLPMRVIVLKARRVGVSSYGMAKLTQRLTLNENRRGLVVAHDLSTASELFSLVDQQFYPHLPGAGTGAPGWIKPGVVSHRSTDKDKLFHWGNKGREARLGGELGINSILRIDSASEADAGRGKTITDLWLSEVAFWPNPDKYLSLMNAVYDRPDTMIVIESTAKGFNAFKDRWDRTTKGEGNYIPVFISWLEDDNCQQQFRTPEDRERFIESIGTGDYGEDEPSLIAEYGATPEQLYWRRNTIVDRCNGQVEMFHQEFPSTPEEAFVASGGNVFAASYTARVMRHARKADEQAGRGMLVAEGWTERRLMNGTIQRPTSALWTPAPLGTTDDLWRVWEHPWKDTPEEHEGTPSDAPARPKGPGQYIIGADAADGISGQDYHAIQVLDHFTGEQVAEYRSRVDPDELAIQLLLAGLYWNDAWVAVETTGSHGLPVVRNLHHKLGYARCYLQTRSSSTKLKSDDRLGWDTNRRTKPLLLATAQELLREGTDGINSLRLGTELTTYVKLDDGSTGAQEGGGANDDLFMAWGIAQVVRSETPIRSHVTQQTRHVPRRPNRSRF